MWTTSLGLLASGVGSADRGAPVETGGRDGSEAGVSVPLDCPFLAPRAAHVPQGGSFPHDSPLVALLALVPWHPLWFPLLPAFILPNCPL